MLSLQWHIDESSRDVRCLAEQASTVVVRFAI